MLIKHLEKAGHPVIISGCWTNSKVVQEQRVLMTAHMTLPDPCRVPAFANVDRLVGGKDFQMWLESAAPEMNIPTIWETEKQLSPVGQSIYHVLAIQAFRPDRLYAAAGLFVNSVSCLRVRPEWCSLCSD